MSGSGLTLEERMLARSLQQMMSERRAMQQSRWRFWERWWYDWTMDEAYDSKVLEGVWWLFSFPWTILETGLDLIARAFLLLLSLLPPDVLFTALQFLERCGSLLVRLCTSCLALVIRGVQTCFSGRGGGEHTPPRRVYSSQEKAAEAAAGSLLREEREAAARRTAAAGRRSAKKGGAKAAPPSLPEAKPPAAARGRSESSARPLAGRAVPVARSRTAGDNKPHASVGSHAAAPAPGTGTSPRGLQQASTRVSRSPIVVRGPPDGGTAAATAAPHVAEPAVPPPVPPPHPTVHAEPGKKASSPPPETTPVESPPSSPIFRSIPAAMFGVPLPPPSGPLPGFQSLAALAAAADNDAEGLPPPLPPPRPKAARPPSGVDMPPSFVCPITHELMEDPVVTADGQTYERHAISAWFQAHCTSPLTGDRLDHTRLTPNVMARSLIREWVERNGIEPQTRGHRRY